MYFLSVFAFQEPSMTKEPSAADELSVSTVAVGLLRGHVAHKCCRSVGHSRNRWVKSDPTSLALQHTSVKVNQDQNITNK